MKENGMGGEEANDSQHIFENLNLCEVKLIRFGWSFFFQSESCAQKLEIAIVQFTLNEYESGSTASSIFLLSFVV